MSTPEHYNLTPEPLEAIESWGLGFSLGNVVKYIVRAGRKTPDALEDLKKAQDYLSREIARRTPTLALPEKNGLGEFEIGGCLRICPSSRVAGKWFIMTSARVAMCDHMGDFLYFDEPQAALDELVRLGYPLQKKAV